ESCWRCADRAARAREADRPPGPVQQARFATANVRTTPHLTNSEQWSPERAATLLRVALWLILGAGGVALVHFAGSNEDNRTRVLSNEMDTPGRDSPGSDRPAEYSAWEPEQ